MVKDLIHILNLTIWVKLNHSNLTLYFILMSKLVTVAYFNKDNYSFDVMLFTLHA